MKCKARQENDEMVCYFCGLRWDVKEDTPDACNNKDRVTKQQLDNLKNKLKTKSPD